MIRELPLRHSDLAHEIDTIHVETQARPRWPRTPSTVQAVVDEFLARVRDDRATSADLQLALGHMLPGSHDHLHPIVGLRSDPDDRGEALQRAVLRLAAEVGCFWLLADGRAVLTERPTVARRDGRGRLHCEDGPALVFPDGFRIWAVRGWRVPRRVVLEADGMVSDEIERADHPGLRHALRERVGLVKYLRQNHDEIVDCDSVPVDRAIPDGSRITRHLLVAPDGSRYLVAPDGSTGQTHAMAVPRRCNSCKEAYGELSGRPNARTILEA